MPEENNQIKILMNKKNRIDFMDWRIEGAKFVSILIIVYYHMLINASWVTSGVYIETWPPAIAVGVFFYCSGYVHGLNDQFNSPGSLNPTTYNKYIKKRFFRLFLGYSLALFFVLIAKIINQKPIDYSPWALFLDFTSLRPLLTGTGGGIWLEGWFCCAIMIFSFVYPFIRMIKRIYLIPISIIIITIRIFIIFSPFPDPAYFFPFSWLPEFIGGMVLGDKRRRLQGGPPKNKNGFQKIIVKMGIIVWPLYLSHMIAIAFLTEFASAWQLILVGIAFIPLTIIFYFLLELINKLLKKLEK